MLPTLLFIVCWPFAAGSRPALAPTDPPPAPAVAPAPAKKWESKLFLSYTLTRGNSQSNMFSGQWKGKYTTPKVNAIADYEQFYGKSSGTVNVNRGKGGMSYSRTLYKKLSINGTAGIEYDRMKQLTLRVNGGVGLFYENRLNPKRELTFGGNLVWENTDYGNPNQRDTRGLRLAAKGYHRLTMRETTQLETTITFTTDLSTPRDFRLEVDESLRVLLTGPFWLKLRLFDQFSNLPAEKTKKNDLLLLVGIEFTI